MALNRFDRFTPRDYSWETYVPKLPEVDFEAFGQMLQQQQGQFDAYNTLLTSKLPKYLPTEGDQKLYQQYKQEANDAVNKVTDLYVNQGVSAGNRAIRDGVKTFAQDWQPGGRAAILEDRYTAYQNARTQIEKEFEKDTNPANKWFAYKKLEEQLQKPLTYNKDTGEYTRITTPELYKDANIKKGIDDAIKEIHDSGNTQIVRLSPFWLQKIKTEGRTKETLEAVTNALLNQPEYSKQRDIEALYKMNGVDPKELEKRAAENLDKQYSQLETSIGNAKTKEQIKALQNQLIEQGYDVTADGQMGKQTQDAVKQYLDKQKESIEQQKANFDPVQYGKNAVNQAYLNYSRAFANQKRDIDLIYDKATEWQQRANLERQKTASIISEMQAMREVPSGKVLATPADGQIMEQYSKLRDKSIEDANTAKANLNNILATKDKSGTSFLDRVGGNPNDVSFLLNAYKTSGGNPQKFAQTLADNPAYAGKDANSLFNTMTTSAPSLDSAYSVYQQAQNRKELFTQSDQALTQTYLNTPEAKEFIKKLPKSVRKEGETDEQLALRMTTNPEEFLVKGGGTFGGRGFISDKNSKGENAKDHNYAYEFLDTRDKAVKTNPSNFANSVNAYTIIGSGNSTVGNFGELLVQDISNKNFLGYTSEGKQGLVWRNASNNDETDISKTNLSNVKWEMTTLGENGAGYMFTATTSGGVSVRAFADRIPETHKDAARNALIGAKKNAKETHDVAGEQAVTQGLAVLDGYDYTKPAAQNTINPHPKNSKTYPIIFPAMDASGNPLKGGSIQEIKGVHLEDIEKGDKVYGKYVTTDEFGKKQYLQTYKRFDKNGNLQSETVIKNPKGGYYFNNSQDIDFDIEGKFYDLQIPVDNNIQKVPQGQLLQMEQLMPFLNSGSIEGTGNE